MYLTLRNLSLLFVLNKLFRWEALYTVTSARKHSFKSHVFVIRKMYGMKTLYGICGLLSTTVPECGRGVVSRKSPKLTCFTLFDVNSRILFINDELNTQD